MTRLLDPRRYRMDEILRRPYTTNTPFGSSGNCLWATHPKGWGFPSEVHWIHRTGENGLSPISLSIQVNGTLVQPGDGISRPSHVTQHALDTDSGLQITEDKWITQDDVLVCVLSFRNSGDHSVDVVIEPEYGVPQGENILLADKFYAGLPVYVRRVVPAGDDLRQSLPPLGRISLRFIVAFGASDELAEARANRWAIDEHAVETQVERYQRWFDDNIPRFDCSDPWLTKMWYHRWYVVKKNHSRPGIGQTLEDTFSEGRWRHRWYTASITYGAGHVLRETRWLRDKTYAQNYFRGFARNQRADGLYRSWYVNGIARPDGDEGKYTDWIVRGVADLNAVHPDSGFLREALPSLIKNVEYWQTHDWDGDGLLVVDDHWWTGMEWAPSFFHNCGYQLGERRDGRDVQNAVKRCDLTAYHVANTLGLSHIAELLDDTDLMADMERRLVLSLGSLHKLWDESTHFFYDLLPGTNEKLFQSKNIAGFYPFYAGAINAKHLRAWAHLTNPTEFWTTYPPASASQDIPAFSQVSKMRETSLTDCWWNGPTWPHSISLVATGLANSLRAFGGDALPIDGRDALFQMIASFGRAQFENGDFETPHTGEFYRGDTGAWQTGERDYHHSTWADLIITGLIGLNPDVADGISVHPLLPDGPNKWAHFCLEDVPYRGHLLTFVWDSPDAPGDAYDDGDKGFSIYCDGKLLHHQEDLSPISVGFPASKTGAN